MNYTLLGGQPAAQTLQFTDGPGGDAAVAQLGQLQINVTQAVRGNSACPAGIGQHVTVDGAAAVLVAYPAPSPVQGLCVPDWHGLLVQVGLSLRRGAPAPDPAGPHGVLAYARRLHPLGPDPAQWTADPLR